MIDRFLYWGNHIEAKSGKIKGSCQPPPGIKNVKGLSCFWKNIISNFNNIVISNFLIHVLLYYWKHTCFVFNYFSYFNYFNNFVSPISMQLLKFLDTLIKLLLVVVVVLFLLLLLLLLLLL